MAFPSHSRASLASLRQEPPPAPKPEEKAPKFTSEAEELWGCELKPAARVNRSRGVLLPPGQWIDPLIVRDSCLRGSAIVSQKVVKRPPLREPTTLFDDVFGHFFFFWFFSLSFCDHQLTWKCTDPCRKTTFLLERAFLHFHVSWWEGNSKVWTVCSFFFLQMSTERRRLLKQPPFGFCLCGPYVFCPVAERCPWGAFDSANDRWLKETNARKRRRVYPFKPPQPTLSRRFHSTSTPRQRQPAEFPAVSNYKSRKKPPNGGPPLFFLPVVLLRFLPKNALQALVSSGGSGRTYLTGELGQGYQELDRVGQDCLK